MQLKDYDQADGKKVWLTEDEVDLLLRLAKNTEHRIALGLGVRCGLRAAEIVDVAPPDIVETPAGPRVRVWRGKGDKYRETPIPTRLQARIEGFVDDRRNNQPVIDKATRTIERWVGHAADRCRAETGDDAWRYLGPHDLRRSWGTLLVAANVEPGMIMEWGGWENWDTFREHYLGVYTPEMQRQELEKVDWLR